VLACLLSVISVMASPRTSSIIVTNKTAFPLNIALVRIVPLQHTNGLEPGESWTTSSPSHLPLSLDSPCTLSRFSEYIRLRFPSIRFLGKWPKCLASSTTVIEVHFDHENNRFSRDAAFRLLISVVLRVLGSLSLFAALGTILCFRLLSYARAITLHVHAVSAILAVLGLVLVLCSRIGMITVVLRLLLLTFLCPIVTELPKDPVKSGSHVRNPILSIPVPTSSLQPSFAPSSQSHLPSLSTLSASTSGSTPFRTHKHFSVIWRSGRIVLWDLHLDQEVLPSIPGWW
jgi:hypothetical protein